MSIYRTFCVLALMVSLISGRAHADANPGIAPIHSNPHGKSYSEWAAAWWIWAVQIPACVNPGLDPTGANAAQGQSGHVWFLAGNFSSGPVTRSITVPKGTSLFVPLFTHAYFAFLNDPPEQRTEQFIRSQVTDVEEASFRVVEIDGVAVTNPQEYLEKSAVFHAVVPEDNIFGFTDALVPKLTLSPCVDEGFYLFLNPLPPGRHTIRWYVSNQFAIQDITYRLTVK